MKKTTKGNMTVYEAEYGDTVDCMGNPIPVGIPVNSFADASDDDDEEDGDNKRKSLKSVLMQLRAFLGDDAFPMTDADVDALSHDELKKHREELGGRLGELWESQKERQRQREHDGLREGLKNYREAKEKRLARGWAAQDAVGRKLIARFIKPLRDSIIAFRIRAKTGVPMQYATAARFLDCLSPTTAAYITIRTALAQCLRARHSGTSYVLFRDLTRELWALLEAEYKLTKVLKKDSVGAVVTRRELAEAEKELLRVSNKKERKKINQKIRRRREELEEYFPDGELIFPSSEQQSKNRKPPYLEEDKKNAAMLLLLRLVETSNGAFAYGIITENRGHKIRTPGAFAVSRTLWDEFNELHGRLESLSPTEQPMVYPPSYWNTATGEIGGGYRFDLSGRANMVKTNNKEGLRRINDVLLEYDHIVPKTLDALQQTPYRINHRVYEIMRTVDETAQHNTEDDIWGRYKLPNRTPPASNAEPSEWAIWKREGERRAEVLESVLKEAKDNLSEPMIFFPYTYDFRGRIYPSGGFLNPQGVKYALALLEFAEGRCMRENGDSAKWMKIHGANCFGKDKESIADRIAWTEENSADIVSVACDPLDSHNRGFWTQADEPWLFLAFCFEWAGYQKRGADHVTHLPIHVDGKCNGAQHMAALMRCRDTGELVGLCGDDENKKPYDLYQVVADMADARIRRDARSGSAKDKACAKRIIDAIDLNPKGDFQINRKLVKGSVMTYGYGVTAHGMMEDIGNTIFEWLKPGGDTKKTLAQQWGILCPQENIETDDGEEKEFTFGKIKAYIQRVVQEAIEEKAKAAAEVMKVLKSLATAFTQIPGEGNRTECSPIAWTSPAGFPVYFAKEEWAYKKLESHLYPDAATRRKDEAEINNRKGRKPQGARKITLQISIGEKPPGLDAKAMQTGFAPNVIHSLDAAHMMKTVVACLAKGIRSFSMIHDSYATHATNMTTMNKELRRAFVEMYWELDINTLVAGIVAETNDLIDNIWPIGKTEAEIDAMLAKGEKPEAKPSRRFPTPTVELTGTLNIEDVQKAVYFFA